MGVTFIPFAWGSLSERKIRIAQKRLRSHQMSRWSHRCQAAIIS
nr:MAG TPA: hypothetical protein [Caudoviricetes sp.]DAY48507.1 MAG TPA: hypothetical protein [Caudoviricetes sp.]